MSPVLSLQSLEPVLLEEGDVQEGLEVTFGDHLV